MQQKVNPMSQRTRSAIACALLRLMMEKNYLAISVSDLAAESGYSRQAFYTNFQCKDDVVRYVLSGLFARCSEASDEGSLLQSYFLFWNDNVRLLSLLFQNGLGGLFQERNREFFMKTPALTGILGRPGRDEAFLRAGIAGITYELLWEWVVNGQGISVEELSALAESLTRGSLVTNPLQSLVTNS